MTTVACTFGPIAAEAVPVKIHILKGSITTVKPVGEAFSRLGATGTGAQQTGKEGAVTTWSVTTYYASIGEAQTALGAFEALSWQACVLYGHPARRFTSFLFQVHNVTARVYGCAANFEGTQYYARIEASIDLQPIADPIENSQPSAIGGKA